MAPEGFFECAHLSPANIVIILSCSCQSSQCVQRSYNCTCRLVSKSGSGTYTTLSSLPGLNRAWSIMSGRLVAATTVTLKNVRIRLGNSDPTNYQNKSSLKTHPLQPLHSVHLSEQLGKHPITYFSSTSPPCPSDCINLVKENYGRLHLKRSCFHKNVVIKRNQLLGYFTVSHTYLTSSSENLPDCSFTLPNPLAEQLGAFD